MLTVLATPVGHLLALLHYGLSAFLPSASGTAWALSIVLLTVLMRLLLFPLFVRQMHSQRRMQELSPQVKALQRRHKGDRESMNRELSALYKGAGVHPAAGCLPLLLQMPVLFALFRVIREFRPGAEPAYGLSAQLLAEGGRAKLFGAPLSAAFSSPASLLGELDARRATVRLVAVVMVLLMCASSVITQRQMLARAGTTDPQQLQVRRIMVWGVPLSFAVSGSVFPVGILLYWLTTSLWSTGQQAWVLRRLAGAAAAPGVPVPAPRPTVPAAATRRIVAVPSRRTAGRSTSRRAAGSRRNKRRKPDRR